MTTMSSKPFSISFGASKSKAIPPKAPKKRPHSALADPDSDYEEETTKVQLVSGFGQSGAVVANGDTKDKAPLIIRAEKNRDWREESRKKRRKNLLPAEVQAAQPGQNGDVRNGHVERDEISKVLGIQFLPKSGETAEGDEKRDETLSEKQSVHKDSDGDVAMSQLQADQRTLDQSAKPPRSADDEALEALLGGEKKSTLQILAPAKDDERNGYDESQLPHPDHANEDDRFRADVASRPDVASLDDYATVPVEEFGAALLRGMGWKDGQAIGKRRDGASAPKAPIIKERRPALLGIGAKEVPGGVGDEFGAWGKAAKGKRKTDLTYNPVLLRNSKTGELLTEEELAKKKEEQKNVEKELDWRERRDKNLKIDHDRKSERRHREMLENEDGRNGHGSRERDRDGERRRRDRSRSNEFRRRDRSKEDKTRRNRDRDREGERRRRDRSRETGSSKHSSSRRHSRSRERSYRDSSSRRERSRSTERRHRRY